MSARPRPSSHSNPNPNTSNASAPQDDVESEDRDLRRAKDLVELHYSVREAQRRGELAGGLEEARRAVSRVVGGG